MLERAPFAAGGGKQRQRQQFLAPLKILVDTFLDHSAKGVPDLVEIVRLLLGKLLQLADDAAGHGFADLHELRIVLQHFARNVQRQILAVDHAADEAQIGRQKIGVIGDEHAPNIKLYLTLARRLEQVEWFGRGRKQQHRVGVASFRPIMQRHRRLVEGVCDRLVGLFVVLRLQLGFRTLPQRTCRIDLPRLAVFGYELDCELDIVGIGADDAFDLVSLQILGGIGLQAKDDLGSAGDTACVLPGSWRDFETRAARGRPGPGLARAGPAAGDDDALGHHEGGIEADAELADQSCTVLGLGQLRHESPGAGPGDGAEIVDQLLAVHADAGIDHGERAGLLVRDDPDFGRRTVTDQLGPGDR